MKSELIAALILPPTIFSIFFLASRTFACYVLNRKPNHKPIEENTVKNQNKLAKLIQKTNGKFFSCTFRKADGTVRIANGKDFYVRLLAGGESTLEGTKNTPFIDRNKESWISANDERLIEFKCGKIKETF